MNNETKKCPYCGEEIMADAKKCRHCGEWLDESHKIQTISHVKESNKGILLNTVIILLVIANIGIVALWAKSHMSQTSVMEKDVEKAGEILLSKNLSDRTDSISYAIGCYVASVAKKSNDSFGRMKETEQLQMFAGMLHSLNTPDSINNDKRKLAINDGIRLVTEIENLKNITNIETINSDAYYQCTYDKAKGNTPLLNPEEISQILTSIIK